MSGRSKGLIVVAALAVLAVVAWQVWPRHEMPASSAASSTTAPAPPASTPAASPPVTPVESVKTPSPGAERAPAAAESSTAAAPIPRPTQAKPLLNTPPPKLPASSSTRAAAEMLAGVVAAEAPAKPGDAPHVPSMAKQMHGMLNSQVRDAAWADAAERQLQFYLADRAEAGRFDFVLLECRTNLCEIQAATRDPGQDDDDAVWQDMIYRMTKESWWKQYEFEEPAIHLQQSPDKRRTLIVTFFVRDPADASAERRSR